MAGFGAGVVDWAKATDGACADVLHQSLRLLVDEVTRPKGEGGNMPVVTGNLKNSVAVSTALVTIAWGTKKFRDPSDAVNNAIAGIDPGTTAFVGFRSPYAHKAEVKNGFTRLAAQRWPFIVAEAARTPGR